MVWYPPNVGEVAANWVIKHLVSFYFLPFHHCLLNMLSRSLNIILDIALVLTSCIISLLRARISICLTLTKNFLQYTYMLFFRIKSEKGSQFKPTPSLLRCLLVLHGVGGYGGVLCGDQVRYASILLFFHVHVSF